MSMKRSLMSLYQSHHKFIVLNDAVWYRRYYISSCYYRLHDLCCLMLCRLLLFFFPDSAEMAWNDPKAYLVYCKVAWYGN